jgi:hypothetical protein
MAAWVYYSRKRFAYAGRATRPPFTAWTSSAAGQAAIEAVASKMRFALFGKARAARSRLWRQLSAAARSGPAVAAIRTEVQRYMARFGSLAYSPGLPREMVQLRRLAIVPNVLANADAYESLRRQLAMQPSFVALEAGDALRQFFITRLIEDLAAAVVHAGPTVHAPLAAGRGWITIGVNESFEWRVPLMNEPAWAGHHYLLEVTREPVTRALRKAVVEAVTRLDAQLPKLSRLQRNDILRRARYVA